MYQSFSFETARNERHIETNEHDPPLGWLGHLSDGSVLSSLSIDLNGPSLLDSSSCFITPQEVIAFFPSDLDLEMRNLRRSTFVQVVHGL